MSKMETKHTPGPWRWTDGENDIDISSYESPGYFDNPMLKGVGDTYNSDVVGCGEYDILYGSTEEQRVANARLIAAAPCLLEALKACESWIVELANSGDAGFWDASKAPEVIQARAAISRATGADQ